jgi:hypothetical protein
MQIGFHNIFASREVVSSDDYFQCIAKGSYLMIRHLVHTKRVVTGEKKFKTGYGPIYSIRS